MERADGFLQVFPEDTCHVVRVLQDGTPGAGMTGDGVNAAPALREADTGIAGAGATMRHDQPQTSCSPGRASR